MSLAQGGEPQRVDAASQTGAGRCGQGCVRESVKREATKHSVSCEPAVDVHVGRRLGLLNEMDRTTYTEHGGKRHNEERDAAVAEAALELGQEGFFVHY